MIKDLASHDIDLTAWVTQRDYELVAARTMFKAGREYEDMVSATCQLSGSLMSNHLVNWLTPTKERLTLVTGEKGMFIADTLTADLTFYANGQIQTTWDDIAQFRASRRATSPGSPSRSRSRCALSTRTSATRSSGRPLTSSPWSRAPRWCGSARR